MMVRKEDAKEIKNAESCIVWEYGLQSDRIGFALARIEGRYPEKGYAMNEVSELIYFVISGSGVLECDGKVFELRKDFAFLIKPKSRYFVTGNELVVALPSAPPFYPGQYKHFEK
jgi:mannose-6-phosphate isomerase-like protein (cupin superfamily)